MRIATISYKRLITVFSMMFLFFSSQIQAEWFKAERAIMGTAIHVELWHSEKTVADKLIQKVFAEMHRIDALMSPYKKDSELSLINNQAAKHPVKIGSELFDLIQTSINISKLSNGAFDITFSSVGQFYDYRKKVKPTNKQLNKNLRKINYKNIKLNKDNQTIHFTQQGTRIDLGGIAKGHAVDNSIKLLQKNGVTHAMVSAGGDTRIIGDKGGRPWYVGIQHPRKKGKSAVILPLRQSAISTSGDYERYFIKDNVRHHHIIKPSTGDSARELRSVSILGSDSTTVDALSTTVFILGLKKGMKLISGLPNTEAIIIDNNGRMHYSTGLATAK